MSQASELPATVDVLISKIKEVGWYPPKEQPVEWLQWATRPDVQDAVVERWNRSLNGRRMKSNAKGEVVYRTNIRRIDPSQAVMCGQGTVSHIRIIAQIDDGLGFICWDNAVPMNAVLKGSAWSDTEYNEKNNIPEPPILPASKDDYAFARDVATPEGSSNVQVCV